MKSLTIKASSKKLQVIKMYLEAFGVEVIENDCSIKENVMSPTFEAMLVQSEAGMGTLLEDEEDVSNFFKSI